MRSDASRTTSTSGFSEYVSEVVHLWSPKMCFSTKCERECVLDHNKGPPINWDKSAYIRYICIYTYYNVRGTLMRPNGNVRQWFSRRHHTTLLMLGERSINRNLRPKSYLIFTWKGKTFHRTAKQTYPKHSRNQKITFPVQTKNC